MGEANGHFKLNIGPSQRQEVLDNFRQMRRLTAPLTAAGLITRPW